MLNVYFTVDVEVWCDGWHDIDRKFPDTFARYIHGPGGQFGLPFQLRMLSDAGLKATCFVEALFAGRFGMDPLTQIVGLIEGAGHEAQLHLHTEWVDEMPEPPIPVPNGKRQHLRDFSLGDQQRLLAVGIEWLQRAGAPRPVAFRAGGYGLNQDTLPALAANQIFVDSSYNAAWAGQTSGVCSGECLDRPRRIGDVVEAPVTVFNDGMRLRPAQLTACSWREMEGLLWQALEQEMGSFVIVSHNFELLTPGLRAMDPVVVERLERLCGFLAGHRDVFNVQGMRNGPVKLGAQDGRRLSSPLWRTGMRMVEQVWRRRFA